MPSMDKQKKFSNENLLDIVERELKDEPYKDRLKEELRDHIEDRERFGQISGQKEKNDLLGDPRFITLLCRSFLSRKKSRVAFLLLVILLAVAIINFVIDILYPTLLSSLLSFIIIAIEGILIVCIAYLLPSFRAKDLW